MSRRIMLVPVESGAGLTSVSIGLVRALEQRGVRVNFYKPVGQPLDGEVDEDKSAALIQSDSPIEPIQGFNLNYVEDKISRGDREVMLEEIVERLEQAGQDDDVMVIEGMVPSKHQPYASRVNINVATALGAEVVFVIAMSDNGADKLEDKIEILAAAYGGIRDPKLIGCIVNKLGAPADVTSETLLLGEDSDESGQQTNSLVEQQVSQLQALGVFSSPHFSLLGCLPWNADLVAPRVVDLVNYLGATVLCEGDMAHRRIRRYSFCARNISNMLSHFVPGALMVTSGDRSDVIVAAALSAQNGTKIGALLLTGGLEPEPRIMELCQQAFESGLPVIATQLNTWQTARKLQRFNPEVPAQDEQRVVKVKSHVAEHLNQDWVESLTHSSTRSRPLSPWAFRYRLTEWARKANKRIVLPEGDEPRTIKAALICAERQIAHCVLLGNAEDIHRIAEQQGLEWHDGVEIIEPDVVRDDYVAGMVELRKHKGLTEVVAKEQLMDNVTLGTMMLAQDQVDGLVSGAVHTTANTIRPPLQLISTAPGCNLVSSIFFMLLPDQVLVYGDCAINPDPNAEQLADIAIQSADSAAAFGIEPKVALISYSTGSSGQGSDVDKVREATKIAKSLRPDLVIDGPLQYDAAIMENVAQAKAPESPVAGKATVFIFPDLNTGNTTYKAVQRSADLVSIGPMLQGMRKPVNDLSRGALVEDIVYTIALTAIQAKQG